MKHPPDVLREEHVLILRALDALERAAEHLERGAAIPDAWWTGMLAWLRGFADRTHHAKEETLLFPAMVKAGVPEDDGPIGVMLAEHVEGRRLIAAMAEGATVARVAAARGYVSLLRGHIDKENDILFDIAEAVLAGPAMDALGRAFEAVGADLGPDGAITSAETALEGLTTALG